MFIKVSCCARSFAVRSVPLASTVCVIFMMQTSDEGPLKIRRNCHMACNSWPKVCWASTQEVPTPEETLIPILTLSLRRLVCIGRWRPFEEKQAPQRFRSDKTWSSSYYCKSETHCLPQTCSRVSSALGIVFLQLWRASITSDYAPRH